MASGKLVESWTSSARSRNLSKTIRITPCLRISHPNTVPSRKREARSMRLRCRRPDLYGTGGARRWEVGRRTGCNREPDQYYTVAEYPSRTGELHVVVYNLQTGIYCREVHGADRIRKTHRKNMYSKIPKIQELLCYSL